MLQQVFHFSGERVFQHALVSALLGLEVMVTGSLPGAMLTQVSMHFSMTMYAWTHALGQALMQIAVLDCPWSALGRQ